MVKLNYTPFNTVCLDHRFPGGTLGSILFTSLEQLSGVLIKPENVAGWKCVLNPKRLVCPQRYALCGKRLKPVTMGLAIMSLINADFVGYVDLFRH